MQNYRAAVAEMIAKTDTQRFDGADPLAEPSPAMQELWDAMPPELQDEVIKARKVRFNSGGNFCGHHPDAPRFASTINPYGDEGWVAGSRDSFGHNRKAAWFYQVDGVLKDFYYHPKTIPGLGLLVKTADKNRVRRSEWREDAAAVLSALTHHIELASINWEQGFARVGMPTNDGFLYYDNEFWQRKTGLSESRLSRAFGGLVDLGYITRTRRWVERESGKFKALATATLIHLDFYGEIGLLESLKELSRLAYQRLASAADKANVSVGRMLRCAINATRKAAESAGVEIKAALGAKPVVPVQSSKDYPIDSPQHWQLKLPTKEQRLAFTHKYIDLMLQRGCQANDASIYRDAYEYVANNK